MKIAIIGFGIVGATTALYLSENKNIEIDVYDDNLYGGTKAAVGIVCPWSVQRRNKAWYQLVERGANFYQKLIKDLDDDSFVDHSGALIINEKRHEFMWELISKRYINNPIMKHIEEVTSLNRIPQDLKFNKGIYIEGAFKVDGAQYLKTVRHHLSDVNFINETTTLSHLLNKGYDKIILAPGGRLHEVMDLPGYVIKHKAQKGMLLKYPYPKNHHTMVLPKGEIDLLFNEYELIVGASHETDPIHMDFDLDIAIDLKKQASVYLNLPNVDPTHQIGLRALNPLNLPIYGKLDGYDDIYIVSGLGSSGLSSGPIIGYDLAQNIINGVPLDNTYNPKQFIYKKTKESSYDRIY